MLTMLRQAPTSLYSAIVGLLVLAFAIATIGLLLFRNDWISADILAPVLAGAGLLLLLVLGLLTRHKSLFVAVTLVLWLGAFAAFVAAFVFTPMVVLCALLGCRSMEAVFAGLLALLGVALGLLAVLLTAAPSWYEDN